MAAAPSAAAALMDQHVLVDCPSTRTKLAARGTPTVEFKDLARCCVGLPSLIFFKLKMKYG